MFTSCDLHVSWVHYRKVRSLFFIAGVGDTVAEDEVVGEIETDKVFLLQSL